MDQKKALLQQEPQPGDRPMMFDLGRLRAWQPSRGCFAAPDSARVVASVTMGSADAFGMVCVGRKPSSAT